MWFKDSGTDALIAGNNRNNVFLIRHGYIIQKPDPKGTFSFRVLLKHIFGFCDDYEKVVYDVKHQLTLVRKGDNDAVAASGPTIWTSTYGLEPVHCDRLLIEPSGWAQTVRMFTQRFT